MCQNLKGHLQEFDVGLDDFSEWNSALFTAYKKLNYLPEVCLDYFRELSIIDGALERLAVLSLAESRSRSTRNE